MSEDRINPGDDDATQSWLTGALGGMHHLSAVDMRAISALRRGTAMLIGIGGPMTGARFLLWRPEVRVGREDDCLVWLSPANVSRHHATLIRREEGYELADAGSLNGCWVNHRLVERGLLEHGDEVQFGACRFLYVQGEYEP
ncbi:FHA domain-containing protein [Intrasporangium mesophilum]